MGRTRAGVWIDRSRALIVLLETEGGRFHEIHEELSGIERRARMRGGSRSHSPFGPQDVSDERKAQERREQQLRRFYGRVNDKLKGVEAVLVLGPGLTKHWFCQTLPRRNLTLAATMTTGPLTRGQLVAQVQGYFDSWRTGADR